MMFILLSVLAFGTSVLLSPANGSSYSATWVSSTAVASSTSSPTKSTPICGINEIYSNCSNGGCGPRSCHQMGYRIGCVKMDQKYCKGGCVCQDGYLRDLNNTCISKSQCPECGGDPNAVSGCGPKFSKHCHGIEATLSTEECLNDECECKQGFLYDDSIGKCVVPNDCSVICGVNEIYDKCPQWLCTPQKCSQLGFPWPAIPCPLPSDGPCPGPPGCVCIADHVRNDLGICIPKKLCPSCGGDPFAESGCGLNCGRLCSNYNKGPVPCPRICYPNACDCKAKYVYDENLKKCVKPENCTPTCGINEVYDTCANGGCRKWKCSQPELCIDPLNCEGGCVCKENHSRADNGTCIPESQCTQCNKPFEYYDSCAPTCPPQTCDSLGKKIECLIQPLYCRGTCRCINGYYRDKLGNCIPEQQCPRQEPQCPPGERYEECPNNLCTPLTCLQVGFPIPCPPLLGDSSPKCSGRPGCVCDNDYVRDIYGKCIPRSECPSCGGDSNASPGCGVNCGKTCSTYKIKNPVCILSCNLNGCDCKKPYVYDDNLKKCVLPSQCTPICGTNEVYDTCSNGGCRRWNCSNTITCIAPPRCIAGCSCRQGFTRDRNGICIPENQCPGTICGVNEVFDTCSNGGCRRWNCSSSVICKTPPRCIAGCSCRQGFTRDRNGICIPENQCPGITCGINEVFDTCSNGGCRRWNCSNIITCVAPPRCIAGCSCRKGFTRDRNGLCIPENQCPAYTMTCGRNEVYDTCANGGCRRWNCSNSILCIDPIKCKPGCSCQEGYSRNRYGVCIPLKQCPAPVCGTNEVYDTCSNGGCRRWDCSNTITCVAPPRCIAGCSCRRGFTRDRNGVCIPENQCPGTICGINEVFDTCSNGGCRRWNCSSSVICKTPPRCIAGCSCRQGFTRDRNGNCIPENQCPGITCGINEVFDTCSNGGCRRWNCSNIITCIAPPRCIAGCSCRQGFTRNRNGICIPENQCPVITESQCPPGERYEECPENLCIPLTCSQVGFPIPCPALKGMSSSKCTPGCICGPDKVRNIYGKCVPKSQCPSCGGDPNAKPGCGVNCGKTCTTYKDKNPVCILSCDINGCDCKKGYVYDANLKKCVRPSQCTPQCGINEVYDTCSNGGCRRWNCSDYMLCIDPIKCKPGCSCKEGYSRNNIGICIPEKQCPEICNKPNEYYEECPQTCPPQTCKSIGKIYNCPLQTIPPVCKGKCMCKRGYYRNLIGECISEADCKRCPGPNEFFSCGGACDNVCATLHKQSQNNCPIVNIACNRKCYCRPGYARDKNNICIPIHRCPAPICGINEVFDTCANGGCRRWNCSSSVRCIYPKICKTGCSCRRGYSRNRIGICIPENQCPVGICGPNERYEEKPLPDCEPRWCSELGFPISCPAPEDYKPSCVCIDGYLRDNRGVCIPKSRCPSCGGDRNAKPGCGVNCGRTCSTYGKEVGCIEVCHKNACDCRDGYVYDEVIKMCVKYEHCTNKCDTL